MRFEELDLSDNVLDALYDMRFEECTPVQETSSAVARPAASTLAASQLTAMPSWEGKIVAPGQKE